MTQKTRYGRRKDKNHNDIKEALERAGYKVYDTYRTGFGFPDMLALNKNNVPILIEAKLPGETLSEQEEKFWINYPGLKFVAFDAQQAIDRMAEHDSLTLRGIYQEFPFVAKRGDCPKCNGLGHRTPRKHTYACKYCNGTGHKTKKG